jgi:putative tricarboxylic transport membrane protein
MNRTLPVRINTEPQEETIWMKPVHTLLGLAMLACSAAVAAQTWTPQKNVEIVVANSPGGSNDRTARQVERFLSKLRLVSTPVTVVNKPGGGGAIAYTYVNQHAADPHYLLIGTPALLLSQIAGTSKLAYTDFTPIASLFNDYYVFAVGATSPLQNGKDLVERLKKDPQSIAIGFPTALSQNHVGAALLLKSIGRKSNEFKSVVFKGTSEAVAALLGGHIDLIITPAGNASRHVEAGRMRVIAVAAPKRFTGVLANAPTWREQGVDLVFSGWRAIMAPKGLTRAQVAFWEDALRKATASPEWKADLEKNHWSDDFSPSETFRTELAADYAAMSTVMAELGFAKKAAQ